MDRLKGKLALITGASSGIGLETAHRFLSEGARVAITGKDIAALENARQELGDGVLTIASDASNAAAQAGVADAIRREFESLDVLFVNAGIADLRPIQQWDAAGFDRTPLYNKLGLSESELKTVAASIQNQVPAGRFGKAREIADAVVFLASDESAFVVGAELLVDGGMSGI